MPFYHSIVRPTLFNVPAETAHEIGIQSLKSLLSTEFAQNLASSRYETETLEVLERFGLTFANPLGVAAGFDKNGVVVNQMASLGFSHVEVGTVTFEHQLGNPKPRLFRLPRDKALINRLGFNNDGAVVIAERLKNLKRRCVVGVNIGKNKDVPNEEAAENCLKTFDVVHPVADYVALNISSPNTPGLRDLQKAAKLDELLSTLQGRNYELGSKPLLVKIAPDLNDNDVEIIVNICLEKSVSAIIATNTTISREGLTTPDVEKMGAGGLSGRPLAKRSTDVISAVYHYSKGKLPIIGVGGIFTPEDAFEKIAAGASLIQAYTGFIYVGPSFARRILVGLADILKDRGFKTLDEAVGSANTR